MFGWGRKKTASEDNIDQRDGEEEAGSYRSGGQRSAEEEQDPKEFKRDIVFDSIVVASPFEKAHILRMFTELRGEGSFCDVAFLCQGVLFRAHRVLVRYGTINSAWVATSHLFVFDFVMQLLESLAAGFVD
jgi:hypothetical protein